MIVKICGCRSAGAVRAAVDAGADAVGFIFVPAVRRYISPPRAAECTALVPDGVWRVGVFLDQGVDEIETVARAAGLDTVQLHGSEPPEQAAELRRRGLRVIKAWNGRGSLPAEADVVLAEPRAGQPGGAGEAWDWKRVRGLPVVLSGGLTPENVGTALDAARPSGVDVSSGVETGSDKDPGKIRAFCAAVRRWEHERRLD